jgi:hypothetical protein
MLSDFFETAVLKRLAAAGLRHRPHVHRNRRNVGYHAVVWTLKLIIVASSVSVLYQL